MILPSLNNKIGRTVCLLLLTAAMLLPHATVAVGAATACALLPGSGRSESTSPSDYSNPTSEAKVELSASAFVAHMTGETLSSAEATYLDSVMADKPFFYGNAIPSRSVESDYEDSVLTVTAQPYSYVAANGETVTWYPSEAYLNDTSLPLTPLGDDGARRCIMENIPESSGSLLEVRYTCTITVPAELSDPYLNCAWNYADQLIRRDEAYEKQLAAFQAYCQYLTDKANYDLAYTEWQNFLIAKERYEKQLAAYNVYEAAMKDYRERLAAYEAYEQALTEYQSKKTEYEKAHTAYINALNAYKAALPLYEANHAQVERATDVLATLESAFVINSQGKQMYATLIGDTVATVVKNKNELISVGKCDPKDIDTADQSTKVLQDLLSQYRKLRGVPARFAFYQEHYHEIRENFSLLYGSLRSLYNNNVVKSTLINYGKLERYIEFLSQLYVISTGLDDAQNRYDDWVIYGRYDSSIFGNRPHNFKTELEPAQIPPDKNNANPAGLTYPDQVLPKPNPPAPFTLTEPTLPEAVSCPIEPDPVIKPIRPVYVEEPIKPTPVENPGERPLAPAYTDLQQNLMQAYRDGTLGKRAEGADRTVSFQTKFLRLISMQNKRSVEFFDFDGQTPLYSTELDDGEPIVYGGQTPVRPQTEKYDYQFAGWKNQDGELITDLGVVDEKHEVFYASYTETLRNYTVTWVVDEAVVGQPYAYGSIPVYGKMPERASTDQYDYVFVGWQIKGQEGWSMDLTAVRENVTYVAVFAPIIRRYTVTWIYGDGENDRSSALWDYGALPTPDRIPTRDEDDRYIYKFIGWDQEPSAVTTDITYTARFDVLPIIGDTTQSQAPVLQGDVYISSVPTSGIQIDRLLELATLRDRTIALQSSDGTLSLHMNPAVIQALREVGCTYIHIDKGTATRSAGSAHAASGVYSIRFLDAERKEISIACPMTLRFTGANEHTRVCDTSAAQTPLAFTYSNGELTVKIDQSADLRFYSECPITVEKIENGWLATDRTTAVSGDRVLLTFTHDEDYRTDGIRVVGTVSEQEYTVELLENGRFSFVMPGEPVHISAPLQRKTFTVSFEVDGNVISSEQYFRGDTVKVPSDPHKADESNMVYTFIGWSPEITVVTEDVVYTACFAKSEQGNNHTYIPPDSQNREYLLYIEVGLILAVLIGTPITIVVCKRRRKRKKALREAEAAAPAETTETAETVDQNSDTTL